MSRLLSSEQGGFEREVVAEAKSRDNRFVVLVFGWICVQLVTLVGSRGSEMSYTYMLRTGEEMVFEQTEGPSSNAAEKMGRGRRCRSCDEDRQRERSAEKRK